MTVVVIGSLRFPASEVENLRPHLRQLVEATRKLDGCIAYDVAEDLFDPGLIRFSEIWPDDESLQQHLKAPHIAPWREISSKAGLMARTFRAFGTSGEKAV